jgi:hypothetical protein
MLPARSRTPTTTSRDLSRHLPFKAFLGHIPRATGGALAIAIHPSGIVADALEMATVRTGHLFGSAILFPAGGGEGVVSTL